jgi:hypothetical protein
VKAKQDILQNFHPAHISPELDSVLRATYDIRLD